MSTVAFEPIVAELVRASSREERLSQFHSPVTAHQYIRLYNLVTRHVRVGGRVLDWGSASGHFSYFLCRTGFRVDAFSFEAFPEICRPFEGDRFAFAQGDPDDPVSLPYATETFDAVVSVGVLEHVRETGGNEAASLREIHRVLRPNGLFLCFHFPNQYSWIDAAARSAGRWSHQYRYTAADIVTLLRETAFDVVEMRRYAILPRNVWSWGLPPRIGASAGLARAYDGIDGALSRVFAPICQNYLFVARKPGPPDGPDAVVEK